MEFSPKTNRILMAAYIAAIGFMCFGNFSQPDFDVPKSLFGVPMDKVVHFVMYLPFVPLFYFSFNRGKRCPGLLAAGLVLAFAFGGLVELLQGRTGYRSCDAMDLLADGLGALAGLLATVSLIMIKRHNHEKV